jgi:aspartate 1-decarboxylase
MVIKRVGSFFRTLLLRVVSGTRGPGAEQPGRGNRLVVKSKIHKAHVTGAEPDKVDGSLIDEDPLDRVNIAPYEKVLIVDNTNGARVETSVRKGEKGKGEVIVTGAHLVKEDDRIDIIASSWSTGAGHPVIVEVDKNNRFCRYVDEAEL